MTAVATDAQKQNRRESHNRANARYREKNRSRIRTHNRIKSAESRHADPEKFRAISRASYHRHKVEWATANRERALAHYRKNREKKLEYARAYAASHRAERRVHEIRRRAAMRGSSLGDPRLIAQWMARVRQMPFVRCHWCGTKVPGKKVHFDHVIPINLKGAHSIDNLCASCPECNLSKQDRHLCEWISRGQTFLSL